MKKRNEPLPVEQMKVLTILLDEKSKGYERPEGTSGPRLGQAFEKDFKTKNYPAFFYLMSRLVKAGYVDPKMVVEMHGPYKIRQKHFTITREGERAWRETMEFWKSLARHMNIQFGLEGSVS